jgi:hypothetical protein
MLFITIVVLLWGAIASALFQVRYPWGLLVGVAYLLLTAVVVYWPPIIHWL